MFGCAGRPSVPRSRVSPLPRKCPISATPRVPGNPTPQQIPERRNAADPRTPLPGRHHASPLGRIEGIALAFFLLATGLYFAAQHQPFPVPNNDYESFEHIAEAFRAGSLPTLFKRGPILPALMAMGASFSSDPNPFFDAALWINAVFSLGMLVVVFALARTLLGATGAWITMILLASTPQLPLMALHELVEPSLGFFVAATMLLHVRGSRWRWVAAAAATLSRAEAGLLLPVLVLADWARIVAPPRREDGGPVGADGDQRPRESEDSVAEQRAASPPATPATSPLPSRSTATATATATAFSITADARPLSHLPWRALARPVIAAAFALLPLLAWMGLARAFDTGADTYGEMLGAAYWTIDLGFVERSFREPFLGWYRRADPLRIALIALPLTAGLVEGWRRWRATLLPLMVFALGTMAAIVAFGASKPRYTYTTSWIWLLLYAAGTLRVARAAAARWPARIRWAAAPAAAVVAILIAGRLQRGFDQLLSHEPPVVPVRVDIAYALLCLAALAAVTWRTVLGSARRTSRANVHDSDAAVIASAANDAHRGSRTESLRLLPALAGGLLALWLWTPLVTGGLHGKQRGLAEDYWDNQGSALAATWLADNLPDDARAVMPIPTHAQHVAGLPPERLVSFAEVGAAMGSPAPDPPRPAGVPLTGEDERALIDVLDSMGISHVVYTWRGAVRTTSHRYYYGFYRTDLADCFASEQACVPGFELVATLPEPAFLERGPVRVYRRVR